MNNSIKQLCSDCLGECFTSSCCNSYIDDDKCNLCGKFCKKDACMNCNSEGFREFKIGDKVNFTVYEWSDDEIKNIIYQPKHNNDYKILSGKISSIINDYKVEVKFRGKSAVKINVEELEISE